ncbi:MAG: GntR family transcriptional regulator [Rhodovibrionaceae bacterium]
MTRHLEISAPNARKPQKLTLAEQAYHRLEEMIITAELPPNTVVSLVTLSKQLGIGRTPIQEAAKRLAADFLVEIIPRKGLRVRDVPKDELEALVQARRPLERLLARFAARNATLEERDLLRKGAKELLAAAKGGDERAVVSADGNLKQIALAAARNPFLTSALGPIFTHFRRLYFTSVPVPDIGVARAFQKAYNAIADRNEEAAVAAMDNVMIELQRVMGQSSKSAE